MELFILNPTDYSIEISPEAMTLKPFHKILARDRSINKKKAKAELAYVFFMCDYKSDYQSTIDEIERSNEIISVLEGLPDKYRPDKVVKDACNFYKERSATIASKALDKQRINIDTLIDKVGGFMESDEIATVEKASKLSESIPKLLETIDKLEKVVRGQQDTSGSRHKGNKEKGDFEDMD